MRLLRTVSLLMFSLGASMVWAAYPDRPVKVVMPFPPGGTVDVPVRSFGRTLLTLEYSSIDRQYELKWHARGIGVIKEQAVTTSEELRQLVAVTR